MLMAPEKAFTGKESAFAAKKSHACTNTEEKIIFSKLSGKVLIKGIAHTVYLAAASNRYLELGERLLGNAELIPSKGSIFKVTCK